MGGGVCERNAAASMLARDCILIDKYGTMSKPTIVVPFLTHEELTKATVNSD